MQFRMLIALSAITSLVLAGVACVSKTNRQLAAAIARNDFETAEKLIAGGGDVNYSELPGRETALMALASSPDPPAVRFLIDHKADVNLRSSRGMTALMYAAMNGRGENIKLLAAAGADLNAVASGGRTAVSIAKAGKHDDAVSRLLSLGAKDTDPSSDDGSSDLSGSEVTR
jgi:ankyrin repeat protein